MCLRKESYECGVNEANVSGLFLNYIYEAQEELQDELKVFCYSTKSLSFVDHILFSKVKILLQHCKLILQALPFSVCTILRDKEVYNVLAPDQEEKRNAQRSRCNGRQINSWLQEVDDKWEKIKVKSTILAK